MTDFGVIGASGFLGKHLTEELIHRGNQVRSIVRSSGMSPIHTEEVALGDFTDGPNWDTGLEGLNVVVCLAARVHVMHETESDPLAAFRKMNVEVTRAIASAAARVGVRRLVFVSSIKVNGEATILGNPFHASDTPKPTDPYGISKLEAERVLIDIANESGLEVAIIRPPLVYGPGVGGNFLKLLRLVGSGIPLPLGSAKNARAMIAVENLVDAIIHCSMTPITESTVVLVNDAKSPSTAELLRMISRASETPSRLFPFPTFLLNTALKVLGKQAEAERLLGTLDVEISSNPVGIEWTPPVSTEKAIRRTVSWYHESVGE